MFNYSKTKEVFKDKLFHERYDEVYKIFLVHLQNGNDAKELLNCLKEASLEIRLNQTIDSIEIEEHLVAKIFGYLLENNYLFKDDEEYTLSYIEDYRKMGN